MIKMAYNSRSANRIRKKQRIKPIRVVNTSPIIPQDIVRYSAFGEACVSFGKERYPKEGVIATIPAQKTYAPDTEVVEVLSYEPAVSVKELHDSGSFSCLEDSFEEPINDDEEFDSGFLRNWRL